MGRKDEIVVGLDVGTHKVVAVVGDVKTDGTVEIIGVGSSPSNGIMKGVVVNVNQTMEAIQRAVHEAELMAGCTVNAVYVSVSGAHLKSFNNRGVVAVQSRVVGEQDVERVLENAKAAQIPADRQIIHTVPQEFVVDDNDGIRQPLGIAGSRLQVNVHVVTALVSGVQNVIQCAERAGLHVLKTSAEMIASAKAVLEEDEKELGVVLVDIGGGTTDVAIFHNGFIVHSAVLPVGGDHVTKDIAVGLRTPKAEAERIKIQHGCALSTLVGEDEVIEVACVGGREAIERKRKLLCDIIEPRIEEVYHLIEREIQASNFADVLGSGVVITGGTSLLPGCAELGEDVLGHPVRVGYPRLGGSGGNGSGGRGGMIVGGLRDLVNSPIYSTALGLVLQAAEDDVGDNGTPGGNSRTAIRRNGSKGAPGGWVDKMRDWMRQAF
ncbi:MAG: cell division protein FtsA [Myxococcales bacterium]|nr:cell division protein FtsA [Myxococcales bacterium]